MRKFLALIILFVFSDSFAQAGHTLQIDDGSGDYTIIKGSGSGGTYTLPVGGGTILTASTLPTLSFADFYALMPGDNAAPVAGGTAVQFPQNGPTDGSGTITRLSASTFNLSAIGTYEIQFQVSVTEAGQLGLSLNGVLLSYTIVGRATGTSLMTGTCLVTTSVINSVLSVTNPPGNATALTITPVAGGTYPASAHLVIKRLQ